MKKALGLVVATLFLGCMPLHAQACNLEKNAKEYINKIYASSSSHYGTKKPSFSYNTTTLKKYSKNKKKYLAGYNDAKTITIYQKAFDKSFGKKCTDNHWKDLKRVIAHEYGHHIDFNHGKAITKMLKTSDEERAAIVAGEHILHTKTWGKKGWQADGLKKKEESRYKEVKNYLESL